MDHHKITLRVPNVASVADALILLDGKRLAGVRKIEIITEAGGINIVRLDLAAAVDVEVEAALQIPRTEKLVEALEWYRDRAEETARYHRRPGLAYGHTAANVAEELANDAGKRADMALSAAVVNAAPMGSAPLKWSATNKAYQREDDEMMPREALLEFLESARADLKKHKPENDYIDHAVREHLDKVEKEIAELRG